MIACSISKFQEVAAIVGHSERKDMRWKEIYIRGNMN